MNIITFLLGWFLVSIVASLGIGFFMSISKKNERHLSQTEAECIYDGLDDIA